MIEAGPTRAPAKPIRGVSSALFSRLVRVTCRRWGRPLRRRRARTRRRNKADETRIETHHRKERAMEHMLTVHDTMPSPVGPLLLTATEDGLTRVYFERHRHMDAIDPAWRPAAEVGGAAAEVV